MKKLSIRNKVLFSIVTILLLLTSLLIINVKAANGEQNVPPEMLSKGKYLEYTPFAQKYASPNEPGRQVFNVGDVITSYDVRSRVVTINGETYTGYALTVTDLRNEYPLLCCQHGTPLPSGTQIPIDIGWDQDELSSAMQGLHLVEVTNDEWDYYAEFDGYVAKTPAWYHIVEERAATPEEAYILAEMVMEKLPEGVVLIPELDANGNTILVDEDEIEGELYMGGGSGYYLYEAEYAVDTPDGHTYVAEVGGYDSNGNPYYVYKYDEDHQREETTTSLVEPDLKLYEGKGYYEQNWQEIDIEGEIPENIIEQGNVYLTSNKLAMRDESGRLIRARVQGGNSYIQYAWWASRVINEGTIEAPNALSKEAKAFEEYILRVSRCSSVEEVMSKYVDHPYELTINGQTYTGMVPAYPIEYGAKYMSTEQKAAALGVPEEQAEITVAWDEDRQVYKVGPFGIDYIEARTHISGRPEVEFSGITGMKLYTNLGEVPEDKWRIIFLADQRTDDDYQFPHENEIFYIEMDYIEGAKEILDLATSFRFMNAGGAIQKIDCDYNEAVFTSHCEANTDTDENGDEYVVDYTNWLTAVVTTHDSQTLATAIIGARWYEEEEIHLALVPLPDFVKGRLAITKVVENSDNNDDVQFTFNVYYNNEFVEQVLVKPGETVYTSEVTWIKGETAPTYRVEEVDIPEGYEFVGIENGSGTLAENESVIVTAKNKLEEHSGRIKIIKRVTDVSDRDEVYKFDVKVDNRTFDTAVITVPAGGSSSEYVSREITWTGDTAPTYNVEEIEIPDFVNDVTYINKSGTVGDGAETVVTATNNTDKTQYSLKILKKVTDVSDRDETYVFDVYINNVKYTTVNITVPAGGSSSEATITYEQSGNTAPTYNVEEVSVPDFVENVTYENKSGTMSSGTTPVTVTATNHVVYPREAKIKIIKTVSEPAVEDEVYKFNVHVDGYEDEVVTITVPAGATTGSGVTNQTYTWKSTEAGPKYLVTEIEVPEGYTVTMTNEKGRLTQNEEKLVTVSALNSKVTPLLGSITIKKTVEGPINDTDKFTVKVKVTHSNGSTTTYTKEIKANESWKLLEHWERNETAPTYEVEEINIPEGYVLKDITNKTGSFEVDKNIDILCENIVEYHGHIVLSKVVTGTEKSTDLFKFDVTIAGETKHVELVAGAKWTSEEYTWKHGESAPSYNVEEVEIPDGYELVKIDNQSGVISSDSTVYVRAVNKSVQHEGRLVLKKVIENATDENTIFHFNVRIGDNVQPVDLKAGRSWTSDVVTWNGDNAPTYEVTEVNIPSGYSLVRIDNGTGTLSAEQSVVTATAVNRADEHNGQVAVTKKIITDEKLKAEAVEGRFTVTITITGTFEADGESVVNGSRTYTKEIGPDETFTSPNIKWYGNNAPLYSVSETNLPKGWVLESITNKSGKLSDGHTVNATITNSLTTEVIIDLTIELGGIVWEDLTDDEKLVERINDTGNGQIADGRYDKDNELGISGVEVYLEKVLYGQGGNEIARVAPLAYEESGAPLSFPVYTSASDLGRWSVPRVELGVTEAEKAMGASYARFNIRFVYDGQTYEPTVPLVNGDAASYRAASTAAKEGWFDNSMADDINRQEVNNRVAEVYGGNAAEDTSTDGYVRGLDGTEATIRYNTASGDDGKLATSTVVTRDNNNVALPLFKAKATTDKVGLVYPFNNRSHLYNIDKKLTEYGIVETYHYIATYPYTLNINLGLVKRETSDLSIAKDLDKAIVVANGKMLTYKYNSILNKLSEGPLVAIESRDTVNGYKLNVYSTDYYYRSSIYDHLLNENGAGLKAALDNFYSEMGFPSESKASELEIYLNYKVLVFNNSQGDYIATVNKLADYYDESLELVREDAMAYVNTQDTANDQINEGLVKVADKPTYTTSEGQTNVVNWIDSQEGIPSPAIVSANRSSKVKSMTTDSLKEIKLARGQYILLDMTFKVNKQTNDQGVEDSIILGEKNNIAEIASYSIYDREGNVEGKIDRNSAPANINSDEYYYEDDTDKAPVVDIELYETIRSIDGMVWEDAQTKEVEFSEIVGDGKYKASEDQVIAGLSTSLVEKVIVKNGDNYREYEAIWDTSDTTIEGLGGNSIESLTGFDSTVETDSQGKYYFDGVPAGNFAVRYTYGNKDVPTSPLDTRIGVFNGQDYKTTAYQVGFAAVQEDGTLVNEWHDLSNEALANEPVNDARDVETERLNVIAKSKVMTNYNGEILATANDRNADHTELYKQYQMFAETAKLDLEVEDIITNEAVKALLTGEADVTRIGGIEIYGKALKDNPTEIDTARLNDTLEYKFINIDCGLEARSDNEMVLDKQIKNIKLQTSGSPEPIADINFDIEYNYKGVNPDGTSKWSTTVTINKNTSKGFENLQAVNKDVVRGIQNFRYLNVDENILQGAVITIEYQITALNNGEVDRVGTALAELETPEEIIAASNELRNSIENFTKEGDRYTRNDVVGHYLGSVYYNGTEAKGNDDVVKTKVRQLIDYIDNDAVYSQSMNSNKDHSWKVTTERELLNVGAGEAVSMDETYETRVLSKSLLVNNEGLASLVDKNGKLFTTSQKNNIVLSIDLAEGSSEYSNGGFIRELVPANADSANVNNYTAAICVSTSRTIASQAEANDMAFDNLTEIVKFENEVGRRDIESVVGNANPSFNIAEEFIKDDVEHDQSATELITLTPPTGINTSNYLTLQVLGISLVALAVVAGGIVVIKKKVIEK